MQWPSHGAVESIITWGAFKKSVCPDHPLSTAKAPNQTLWEEDLGLSINLNSQSDSSAPKLRAKGESDLRYELDCGSPKA